MTEVRCQETSGYFRHNCECQSWGKKRNVSAITAKAEGQSDAVERPVDDLVSQLVVCVSGVVLLVLKQQCAEQQREAR